MKRIAIVIPWFGPDLTGGAEQQAFQIATRLAARGHEVSILTTCNRSFHDDWSVNHYPAGQTHEYGLITHRFPVDAREAVAFDRVNAELLAFDHSVLTPGVNPLSGGEAQTFVNENIKSCTLLDYLRETRSSYDLFLFLPYMFATSVLGVPTVADRAWLQPCLHDEGAAYLPEIAAMFRAARRILFNSVGEFETALRVFGPGIYNRCEVIGEGIEFNNNDSVAKTDLPAELLGTRFVLYLGRRDRTKNTELLVRAFVQFKSKQPNLDVKLVLAGAGSESFAAGEDVLDFGRIPEEMKSTLLRQCRALAQPSLHESFSRTMFESWMCGKPVLVNRECLATAKAVEASGGGWLASTENEWAQLFAHVANLSEAELAARGKLGRAYALEHADWDKVIARYERLLSLVSDSNSPVRFTASDNRTIHQLLPDIVYGDAISNQALAIRNELRAQGFTSEIFVKRRDARMSLEAILWENEQPAPTDELIYHHSIGSDLTEFAVAHRGPKCLVYHNITPPGFYDAYRPGFAWMLQTGRDQLARLATHFPISVGDSAYNAAELRACGFVSPGVLPIIIDPDKWNIAANEDLMCSLQDRATNLLFVGRIAPNKQQDKLLTMFWHYRKYDSNSRLIIVGENHDFDPYASHLLALVAELELSSSVLITGQVDDGALLAYYRAAHLYWSASAHEGFGAPIMEAMWFDIPVLAMDESAVPETLGGAGVLFAANEDPHTVAERAYQLVHDRDLRATVIARQRSRRQDFTLSAVRPHLDRLIERLAAPAAMGARVPA